ncbi:hypothetical protein DKK66_08975 [Aquitalea sp. USM4]|nr:hypothetical protein DKK66_08975 [Aquitalea sp. USM4]
MLHDELKKENQAIKQHKATYMQRDLQELLSLWNAGKNNLKSVKAQALKAAIREKTGIAGP